MRKVKKRIILSLLISSIILLAVGCGKSEIKVSLDDYSNGYQIINLLDENSYLKNGKKLAETLRNYFAGSEKIYKVKFNSQLLVGGYYSRTTEEWDYMIYFGGMKKDKPDGYGVLAYGDGLPIYVGNFEKGKIKGYGVHLRYWQDCIEIAYEGNIDKSDDDQGLVIYPADGEVLIPYEKLMVGDQWSTTFSTALENMNDDEFLAVRFTPKYVGDMKSGDQEGDGTEYYLNGQIQYQGEFKNDQYNGKGTLYYENGQIMYSGEFKKGLYDGKGTLYYENGEVEYKGKFKKGDIDS